MIEKEENDYVVWCCHCDEIYYHSETNEYGECRNPNCDGSPYDLFRQPEKTPIESFRNRKAERERTEKELAEQERQWQERYDNMTYKEKMESHAWDINLKMDDTASYDEYDMKLSFIVSDLFKAVNKLDEHIVLFEKINAPNQIRWGHFKELEEQIEKYQKELNAVLRGNHSRLVTYLNNMVVTTPPPRKKKTHLPPVQTKQMKFQTFVTNLINDREDIWKKSYRQSGSAHSNTR